MTDPEADKEAVLNLGLDALLRPVDERDLTKDPAASIEESVPTILPSEIADPVLSTLPEPDPWDHALKAFKLSEDWKGLVAETERLLEKGDNPRVRAWWIMAHIEQRQVPPSILAAPVESLVRSVIENPEEYKDLSEILIQILNRITEALAAAGDRETAIHLLSRSIELGGQLNSHLHRYAREELAHVRENPAVRPRDISEQQAKISFLEGILGKETEENASQRSEAATPKAQESNFERVASSATPNSNGFQLKPLVAVLALSLILGWAYYNGLLGFSSIDQSGGEIAEIASIPSESLAKLLPPEPPRNIPGSLDTVMYDLEKSPRPGGSRPSVEGGLVPIISPEPSNQNRPVSPGLVVDTTGPIEDAAILEGRNSARKEGVFRNGWGEMEDAEGNVVSVPQSARKTETLAPTPTPTLQESGMGRYTVIATTRILAAPSFRAMSLGELDSGDEVDVDGREGSFLRLRSRKGRTGYILAQDATPSRE